MKKYHFTKRIIAFFLCAFLVLGVFPLQVLAENDTIDNNSSVQFTASKVSVDTGNGTREVDLPAGVVADNLESINHVLGDKVQFERAVVRKADGKEFPILWTGGYDGKTYYSTRNNGDIGILLKDDEKIVLYYGVVWKVTYTINGDGTGNIIHQVDTILNGKVLPISCEPDLDCRVSGTYQVSGREPVALDFTNNYAEIAADLITGDVVVNITFTKNTEYKVETAEGDGFQGHVCAAHSMAAATESGDSNAGNMEELGTTDSYGGYDHSFYVSPGGTAYITLFSQKYSVRDRKNYYLNRFTINGEDATVPMGYTANTIAESKLSNGSTVTIKLVDDDTYDYISGESGKHADSRQLIFDSRTQYLVTITDVHEDLHLQFNFRRQGIHQMAFKSLQGIDTIVAASETKNNDGSYTYGLQEDINDSGNNLYVNNEKKVFMANYTESEDQTSYNIYAFSVKPGYNPNSVLANSTIYFGGAEDGVVSTEGYLALADRLFKMKNENTVPLGNITDVIQALRSDASDRGTTCDFDGFVNAAQNAGCTMAFAIRQDKAADQRIKLNALPYRYQIHYNLDGGEIDGTIDATQYAITSDGFSENQTHRVDENPTVIISNITPKKAGYYFDGWRLEKSNGEADTTVDPYHANQEFFINENSINQYVQGNPVTDDGMYFTLIAQWVSENQLLEEERAGYSVVYYKETPDATVTEGSYDVIQNKTNNKIYTQYYLERRIDAKNSSVRSFNDRYPNDGNKYVLNQKLSDLTIENLDGEGNDRIIYYYDLDVSSVTINKVLESDYADRTKQFEITLTLTNVNGDRVNGDFPCSGTNSEIWGGAVSDNPNGTIAFQNGTAKIWLKGDQEFILSGLKTDYTLSVAETPDTNYECAYVVKTSDGTATNESLERIALTGDKTVTLTNTRKSVVPTGIETDDGFAHVLIVTSVLCILFLCILNIMGAAMRRKKYRKHR